MLSYFVIVIRQTVKHKQIDIFFNQIAVPHYSLSLQLVTMCQNARSLNTKTASFSSVALTVSDNEEQFNFGNAYSHWFQNRLSYRLLVRQHLKYMKLQFCLLFYMALSPDQSHWERNVGFFEDRLLSTIIGLKSEEITWGTENFATRSSVVYRPLQLFWCIQIK
jgi:hypothetical protein